jgi:UDP:flavonoid glycosyltransferase YjiC (YdhE family)
MAFDQFDNAERVARLGCGNWLPMRRLSEQRLQALLAAKTDESAMAQVAGRLLGNADDWPWLNRLLAIDAC